MRVMGIDIGERRIGVAVSDPDGRVASPLAVLDAGPALSDASAWRRVLDDYDDIGLGVVGLPLTLAGEEGPQAARIRDAADTLRGILPFPLVLIDERLSSTEAGRLMRESGLSEKERRGKLDMVAAAIILQTYLDASRESAP